MKWLLTDFPTRQIINKKKNQITTVKNKNYSNLPKSGKNGRASKHVSTGRNHDRINNQSCLNLIITSLNSVKSRIKSFEIFPFFFTSNRKLSETLKKNLNYPNRRQHPCFNLKNEIAINQKQIWRINWNVKNLRHQLAYLKALTSTAGQQNPQAQRVQPELQRCFVQ